MGTNKSEFIRLECHLDETYLGFPVTIFGLTGKRTTLTIGGNDDIISDTRGTRSLFFLGLTKDLILREVHLRGKFLEFSFGVDNFMRFELTLIVEIFENTIALSQSCIHHLLNFFLSLFEFLVVLMGEFIIEFLDRTVEFKVFLLNVLDVLQTFLCFHSLGFKLLDDTVDITISIREVFCLLDNNFIQTEAASNLKGVRATRNSLHKTIGRA